MTPFQFMLMRSVFATALSICIVNVKMKKYLWDGINRGNVVPLIARTATGTISNLINYSVTKFLPLTLIAVINNLNPPCVVVLAYFVLNEKLKAFEMILLVLTVVAVLIFACFGDTSSSEDT